MREGKRYSSLIYRIMLKKILTAAAINTATTHLLDGETAVRAKVEQVLVFGAGARDATELLRRVRCRIEL